ncbi:TonB-dependent receptor [Sulfurimonas sp.]|uniref:TonB-dependent receptor n=1 Tax=Sulfurimonas sp. TaxID=2022749 RepID=UPI003D104C06
MQKKLQLSLLSVALLSQLNAQEITLAPLKVTSTAIATDELKSTDAIEVYTSEDIQKAHAKNVYEFLNNQTSVFATSGYGNQFLQKIDLRGYGVGDGYQNIVVTINGRKMNNVDMVPQLLSSIAPSSIKSIEIIKSSGIVTGGDGANAGVINIVTKQSNDKEFSFYLGNHGIADGAFYLGHKGEKLSLNFSGEAQKSESLRIVDTAGTKPTNKFSTATFDLSYTPTTALELHAAASTTDTDVYYAGALTKAQYEADPTQKGSYPSEQTYKSNVVGAGINYEINSNFALHLDLSNEKKESNYVTYSSVTDYHYKSLSASLDYDSQLVSLKAGVDGFDGDLERTNLTLNKSNKALFLISEIYLDEFTLKAGYRREKIEFEKIGGEQKDESLNGIELGVNYALSATDSFFANYSHSYESSSLDRMFSLYSGTYTGYVKPSQANNYSLGFNDIRPNNKLKISLYYTDLKDEIYYYADPSYMNSKNTNIDKSHKYGLDLYDQWLISQNFNVVLNYNYVQAIIDEEIENGENYAGNDLPGVSNHNVKITFDYLPNEYTTISLVEVYRGEAYAANDFNNNYTQKQEAYTATDLIATYAKDSWEVFAKINNLFNQKNGFWVQDDAIYPINFTTTGYVGFKLKY